jgi:hypothetical protein
MQAYRISLRSPDKSPARSSPMKTRPSTNQYLRRSVTTQNTSAILDQSILKTVGINHYANNFNIVREMNGKEIAAQDKDIEIERLKTTCYSLNNKAAMAEDLRQEN